MNEPAIGRTGQSIRPADGAEAKEKTMIDTDAIKPPTDPLHKFSGPRSGSRCNAELGGP